MAKRWHLGFTLIELLVVLSGITILLGFLFPTVSQMQEEGEVLSRKADGLRYQAALLDFYSYYHRYPSCLPKDQWFDISKKSKALMDVLSGRVYMYDNPQQQRFCEFTAQEITSEKIPPLMFFLCQHRNMHQALQSLSKKQTVYGTQVLFSLKSQ